MEERRHPLARLPGSIALGKRVSFRIELCREVDPIRRVLSKQMLDSLPSLWATSQNLRDTSLDFIAEFLARQNGIDESDPQGFVRREQLTRQNQPPSNGRAQQMSGSHRSTPTWQHADRRLWQSDLHAIDRES